MRLAESYLKILKDSFCLLFLFFLVQLFELISCSESLSHHFISVGIVDSIC